MSFRNISIFLLFAASIFALQSVVGGNEKTLSPLSVPKEANLFVQVADRLTPSVVNISSLAKPRSFGRGMGSQDEIFRQFFEEFFNAPYGARPRTSPQEDEDGALGAPRPLALGTGFILDSDGTILTNNHVVSGADRIQIRFTEEGLEKPTEGEVIGRDPELDLALIKVQTKRPLQGVLLGDSDALNVGEYVAAFGNPFGHGHSMTHGIVSAKGRVSPDFQFAKYLQTDAPINPGNSGGPLVNLKGEVIGINNAIDARGPGIGFAIPINMVKLVLPQLKSKGSVSRGYLGVQVGDINPEIARKLGLKPTTSGAFIASVGEDTPAQAADLRPYDLITEVNRKPIQTSSDLILAISGATVGESVLVTVQRGKEILTKKIPVSTRPSSFSNNELETKRLNPRKKSSISSEKLQADVSTITDEIRRKFKLPKDISGVIILGLSPTGPAAQVGLNVGDTLVEVDRQKIRSLQDLDRLFKEDKTYLIRFLKAGTQGQFQITILNLG